MVKIGIVGINEKNGHPYSFSAIINGYNSHLFPREEWQVIYDYLREKDASEFGFHNVKVTHAWTQDKRKTEMLCRACMIPYLVENLEDMVDKVDAVIIARDDYQSHYSLAIPFLIKGIPVFIDKPLSLNVKELKLFFPYVIHGQLMSCSAMRYAQELDEIRANIASYGKVKLIRGVTVNSWETYGVHLLDAIFSVHSYRPLYVQSVGEGHSSISITMQNGGIIQIDALDQLPVPFTLDFYTETGVYSQTIQDNFTMFRRMLWHFLQMVQSSRPVISPDITIQIMKILIAGQRSKIENRKVFIYEISI